MQNTPNMKFCPIFSLFVSKPNECIRARFWSPRSISDVALCSAVTTAFMVCHSSVFEGLERSLDSNLWCHSSPGERYLYSCPSVHRSYMECGSVRDWLGQMMSPNSKFGAILDRVPPSEVRAFGPSFGFQD